MMPFEIIYEMSCPSTAVIDKSMARLFMLFLPVF